MGERRSQLLSDLEVTIGKVQTIAPLFEAQRLAQEESLRVLSNELAATSKANSQLAETLKEAQAELRRLEADIRDQAVAVGSREVEARNREAALEAKFCNHVLVPICDIDEVFEVAGEVSRKVCSIRDGL
jgi:single-stranded DNA-specific DHH superfamily exonuclease